MYIRIRNKRGRKKHRQFKLYSLLYVQPIFLCDLAVMFFSTIFSFFLPKKQNIEHGVKITRQVKHKSSKKLYIYISPNSSHYKYFFVDFAIQSRRKIAIYHTKS